ncbi:MAG: hypothetical protein U0Q03_21970 [Acidimicrobiales bacterium]
MTVQAWFAHNEADIEPGSSVKLALTITNLGNVTESFSLSPTGLAAAWSTIRPAYVTLFGGSQETVQVEVSPPRLAGTTAGPTALGVRVVPQSDPDDIEQAEVTLHVASTYDRIVTMLQPALRARRRATYEVMVENKGNAQASCRMHLIDPTGRLEGDFDPPALGIEPGGSQLVRLKLKASKRQWERRARTIPFRVDADQQGAPTASATGTFVQGPVLPDRIGVRTAGVLITLGAIAGAWFGVVKPAIDDAADEAVSKIDLPTVTVTTDASQPVTSTTLPEAPSNGGGATTIEGDPKFVSLPTSVAVNETGEPSVYTVPDGKKLRITDIQVRNPFNDEGSAILTIGAGTSFPFNLIDRQDGYDFQLSLRTPIELVAGDVVAFQVTCTLVGQPGAPGCQPTASFSGTLIDA